MGSEVSTRADFSRVRYAQCWEDADILCEALRAYEGTMIVVTHDRYLIESMGCKVLSLEGGKGVVYPDFESYRLSRSGGEGAVAGEKVAVKTKPQAPTLDDVPKGPSRDAKELRRERAKERERRIFLEKRIEELEDDISYLESEIQKPDVATDPERLTELCSMLDEEREELSALSDEWLENYAD